MASLDKPLDLLDKYQNLLEGMDPLRPMGRVAQVTGLSIISDGPPEVSIGDICRVETAEKGRYLSCEVVGFRNHQLVLMPLGSPAGIAPRAHVLATGRRLMVQVSDRMLGRVFDGLGRPLDTRSPLLSKEERDADQDPPPPISREMIRRPVETGIRAIDGMLTIGAGQRIGIFAGTGVGKSTLLGMIARYTRADINVICLVGERGREVKEFLENDLGDDGLKRSVVFVATSDRAAMEKVYAAGFAASTAEFFRDQGLQVNLYMDSLTRYCMALREVGIAAGDQLGPGGYPPGVWYRLSRLVERAGASEKGSITGFYTVLVEADDMTEPVADNARGILDGHIALTRRLAQRGHYPSIEITESISRVMDKVIAPDHLGWATRLRTLLAAHKENEELINLGAYARGSNADVDAAIEKMPRIQAFLRQAIQESSHMDQTVARLRDLVTAQEEDNFY
ncbi:MAG: FliI/YscN family ATPase [Leptospirales bacterium]|nr:FliI/YscN family ATPase [Leptospirales bacterium]